MKWTMKTMMVALFVWTAVAWGVPTIQHDPIRTAEKGQALGVRASVRDAAARVESVSLFYASSRGMTPFRSTMSSSGAGVWYATIPSHMMGPGDQMFYYIQAENADGETKETDWTTVKLVDAGVSPAAIPSATTVAHQAQNQAVPVAAQTASPPAQPAKGGKSKYLLPASIIVGGGLAIGGALAIANYTSGSGGGGDSTTVTNANFGGNYDVCFAPTSVSNSTTVCDNGLVNVYVRNGSVEIVGLWGAEVLTASLNGQVFSAAKDVPSTVQFPASRLIVSGEINGSSCTARVDGYSTDSLEPGNLSGRLDTTKR